MKRIGTFLLTIGLLAIVLNFINMVPSVLFWIYTWGEGIAWVIMAVVVAVGGGIYLMGSKQEKKEMD